VVWKAVYGKADAGPVKMYWRVAMRRRGKSRPANLRGRTQSDSQRQRSSDSSAHQEKPPGFRRLGTTRRGLIHGAAGAGLGSLLPARLLAHTVGRQARGGSYPPGLTGLRGNHDGSWETAHLLARSGQRDFGPVRTAPQVDYDLVIVGAGISGLSAAYFYRRNIDASAKNLILDNHDDFGGHAKRNEFDVTGSVLLGYGGSQTMQEPSKYPDVVKSMLEAIGANTDVFPEAYDDGFFRRHGLAGAVFFDEATWGQSRMVNYDLNAFSDYMPMAQFPLPEGFDDLPYWGMLIRTSVPPASATQAVERAVVASSPSIVGAEVQPMADFVQR